LTLTQKQWPAATILLCVHARQAERPQVLGSGARIETLLSPEHPVPQLCTQHLAVEIRQLNQKVQCWVQHVAQPQQLCRLLPSASSLVYLSQIGQHSFYCHEAAPHNELIERLHAIWLGA
jgi:hypothetical protein